MQLKSVVIACFADTICILQHCRYILIMLIYDVTQMALHLFEIYICSSKLVVYKENIHLGCQFSEHRSLFQSLTLWFILWLLKQCVKCEGKRKREKVLQLREKGRQIDRGSYEYMDLNWFTWIWPRTSERFIPTTMMSDMENIPAHFTYVLFPYLIMAN